jgi:hypothetical protein
MRLNGCGVAVGGSGIGVAVAVGTAVAVAAEVGGTLGAAVGGTGVGVAGAPHDDTRAATARIPTKVASTDRDCIDLTRGFI